MTSKIEHYEPYLGRVFNQMKYCPACATPLEQKGDNRKNVVLQCPQGHGAFDYPTHSSYPLVSATFHFDISSYTSKEEAQDEAKMAIQKRWWRREITSEQADEAIWEIYEIPEHIRAEMRAERSAS